MTDTSMTSRQPREILASVVSLYRQHHGADAERDTLDRAFDLAVAAHEGQTRRTGEEYVTHPLAVAEILADFGMDGETLVAAFLHDVVEDTDVTLDEIAEKFGDVIAALIDGVTKLDRIKFSSREEQQAATIRKMAIAMSHDIRVLIIKLADRLHNMRTLGPLPEEKKLRVARETLDVYAPLASRLGVQEVKHEMEERCFATLYPKRMAELDDLVRRRAPKREQHIEDVIGELTHALDEAGIDAEITGRPKHLYSIYRKMISSGLEFDDIHDLIGVRVRVNDTRDCYATLGLVHTMWRPIDGRFKDYIATPKFNLYQSLHTTVVGPDGKALEIQIRTHEMHYMAEYGIAAHWRYKEGITAAADDFAADLLSVQEESSDPAEFLENLKLDLYQDEVFAITPAGKVLTLPRGSTPVDFAYLVHTDVGHKCVGAKVNGRLVPLATELESGDIVEIITSKSKAAHPSRDWLDFVQSSRAASKIRNWYTRERRGAALQDGKDFVAKAIRREGLGLSQQGRENLLNEIAGDMGYDDGDAMFVAVGEGRLSAHTVANRLVRLLSPEEPDEQDEDLLSPPVQRKERRPRRSIIVEGMDDLLVRIARCCAPVPGDEIVGFVTLGRGVSVHRADCANVNALGERSERLIDVSWAPQQTGSFFVWVQVEALDRPWLLRDVTSSLSSLGANIQASSSATGRDRVAVLRYEIEISDAQALDGIVKELAAIDGVFDAYRLVPQGGTD
ncbi:MAG: bifunctional (p)ppGpp synthetase/guanosine-3',5'-bis(diphosphate) 3'-pyrophosphohydrolase [Actinobacteria bacterium]|nr:bifunctional (p)ppGpp synthetase/guanosine-3',5'-bis(diphosphate) 3'-pyrophosphohydrolase [Actinomycetota bacterium]